MVFRFHGGRDALVDTIRAQAAAQKKDIIVYDRGTDIVEIGFLRLGHSAGRFFVAQVTEHEGMTTLRGEFEDQYPDERGTRTVLAKVVDGCCTALAIYAVIGCIPWCLYGIGAWIFDSRDYSRFVWIPALLPLVMYGILRLIHKKENATNDAQFIDFLERSIPLTRIDE